MLTNAPKRNVFPRFKSISGEHYYCMYVVDDALGQLIDRDDY